MRLVIIFLFVAVGFFPMAGASDFHSADTNKDYKINLTELLRVVQFFNVYGYYYCPASGTSDTFCPRNVPEVVNLFDYWPLAVGNKWIFYYGLDHILSDQIEVIAAIDYGGLNVWQVSLCTQPTNDGRIRYWVAINGGLYRAEDFAGIEKLPDTSDLSLMFPEEVTIGSQFDSNFVYPTARVARLSQQSIGFYQIYFEGVMLVLAKGIGPVCYQGSFDSEYYLIDPPETEGEDPVHSADLDANGGVNLSELLHVIQLFNAGGYYPCKNSDGQDDFCPWDKCKSAKCD